MNAAHEFNFELKMKSFDQYVGLEEEFLDNPQWPLPPENPDFDRYFSCITSEKIATKNVNLPFF